MANVGDAYQHGPEDILVGAPFTTSGGNAYLYLGNVGGAPTLDTTFSSSQSGARFGYSVCGGSQSGTPTVIMGAPYYTTTVMPSGTQMPRAGAAFLFAYISGQWTYSGGVGGSYTNDNCGYSVDYVQQVTSTASGSSSGFIVGVPNQHDMRTGQPMGGGASVSYYTP